MKRRIGGLKNVRISEQKFGEILTKFCQDYTATETAKVVNVNLNTVNRYFTIFREAIYFESKKETGSFSGEVEIDESYFGARRIRGKRGRGAGGKIPVIGLLKREGDVYAKIIENASRKSLEPIIKGKVLENTEVFTDGWKSYLGIIKNNKHHRIHHSENEFARGKNHINGIESFWSFTKRRFRKLNTVRKSMLDIYLQESVWRWNHRNSNRPKLIKLLIKKLTICQK